MSATAKIIPALLSAGLLAGCVSVSAGGSVFGARSTVSGNTVETETTVRSASVGVTLPPQNGTNAPYPQ
ncbi:hypothetical protein [Roseibium aggregatum]|uniref:Lipoprotein n=1 Tax=Roseibium aggregatum TaxID=187304 RepID=A0A926NXN9_9HYPH|nr:hypothetical protein [Roseibium aggregatum]MBD1548314.1 hypothetical protein [Roseibium aggregatum]